MMQTKIAVSIVEDLDEIRLGLERLVRESEDFICLSTHASAEDALEKLPALQPDVVVMDINLPGMTGVECIRKLKPQFPRIQFMMFTIYENNEHVFEALEAGASGYLLKNTARDKVPAALKELHEGGAPMSAAIARKVVNAFRRKNGMQQEETAVLSAREKEVLECLSKGFLYKEIAARLGISTGTVRQHIHKIYDKLHVQNRTEAINKVYGRS